MPCTSQRTPLGFVPAETTSPFPVGREEIRITSESQPPQIYPFVFPIHTCVLSSGLVSSVLYKVHTLTQRAFIKKAKQHCSTFEYDSTLVDSDYTKLLSLIRDDLLMRLELD